MKSKLHRYNNKIWPPCRIGVGDVTREVVHNTNPHVLHRFVTSPDAPTAQQAGEVHERGIGRCHSHSLIDNWGRRLDASREIRHPGSETGNPGTHQRLTAKNYMNLPDKYTRKKAKSGSRTCDHYIFGINKRESRYPRGCKHDFM